MANAAREKSKQEVCPGRVELCLRSSQASLTTNRPSAKVGTTNDRGTPTNSDIMQIMSEFRSRAPVLLRFT